MARRRDKGPKDPEKIRRTERDGQRVRYTLAETRRHEEEIAQLLPHQTVAAIAAVMAQRYGLSRKRVARLATRLRDEWVRDDEAAGRLKEHRAEAVRRIKRNMALAMGRRATLPDGRPGEWIEKPNHQALARYEQLLANLQGTFAPVRVDVEHRVSASIQHVVANLSSEQVERILARQRELRALAERARALLPVGTVDEAGEVAR